MARVVGRSDTDLWVAWFEAVRALPDNPFGIEIHRLGDARLLYCHAVPLSYYNRVMGLSSRDGDRIDEMMAFFRERGTPFRIDMNSFEAGDNIRAAIEQLGFVPTEYQANLFGRSAVRVSRRPGVRVREIRAGELDFFASLYERAYYHGRKIPARLAHFRMASIKARFGRPGWRFYLASVDGLPAGGATLHADREVASLAGAATVFTMRGRGCQSALLAHRIQVARALGIDVVVSRCQANSASQRNLERAGLQEAYTKVIWERPPL
jgi:GNAT superfamily N-acetyltransferase